jgi:alpha-N-arabinofuranosidase
MIDRINIERCQKGEGVRPVKIAFDEVSIPQVLLTGQWNIWDEVKAPGSRGLEQAYDYTDMLGFVAWLNLLVRNHDSLGLACLAQTVNVVGDIRRRALIRYRQS